ncbi:MAG TPA: hypothetical protein VE967_18960 [Gemmatimonadaceae bacterium]|nr:hypothetical protein [Gemmatimonadaceae bacterium]
MQTPDPAALASWESFYVIVGSSSAALTGLMFVVISLMAERRHRDAVVAVDAFATPTVVHFCAAFLVSAVFSAPWRDAADALLTVGVLGTVGVLYVLIVIRRTRLQQAYKPVLEDWVWHTVLPLLVYVSYVLAGLVLRGYPLTAEFMIAAGTLVLVFCGVHNSWDAVTYSALRKTDRPSSPTPPT